MVSEEHKERTLYKLVVVGEEERVVGVHIIGIGSDEVMQGFGVAVKMGGACLSWRCRVLAVDVSFRFRCALQRVSRIWMIRWLFILRLLKVRLCALSFFLVRLICC
jgi:hypothetical protein